MFKVPKTRLPLRGMSYITFIVLIATIASTMLIPIFPLFIKNFVKDDVIVGYIFTFVAFLFLLYTFVLRRLLKKVKKITLLRIGYLGTAATMLVFTVLTSIKQFIILELFRAFFLVATSITMGLFIREYATLKSIGKTEGQYFTVLNVGYLLGPLLGGLLASAYSFNTVFIIAAIPQILIAVLLLLNPLKESAVKHVKELNISSYIKNKQLVLIYFMQFGLSVWFSLLYTFIPLFANENGFSPKLIGYAMFIAVIPLIILEFPIGKLADYSGFKRYILLGFVIMGILSLFTYFLNPMLTIILIVIATLGAAFIEPLTEAYFFEEARTKEREESFYPIYKTSVDTGHIIFPFIASTILFFFNFKILFLFAGIFMLIFALLSLKLKK